MSNKKLLGCCCLVVQSCPALCDPMDCSMQASLSPTISQSLPQVHLHCIRNAIKPSHLLMPPSPSALNLSQHQELFQWVSYTHQMTKILEFQLQVSASVLPRSIQGWFPLRLTGWISLLSKGQSGVFSGTTVGKHQFLSTPPSLWSSSYNCTWSLGRP